MIRTAWVAVVGTVTTFFIGSTLIVASLLGVRRQRLYDWGSRTWARTILRASGCPVRVEGAEHVQGREAKVLVGNHQSWFDVITVASHLPGTFHFVAKKELESVPVFGRAWKVAGHISIDRSDRAAAVASLDQAGAQLRAEGSAVIMFAEGTRSPTDALLPFKKGPFMLAVRAGVPVVPFAVAGSRRVFPKGSWRVRSAPIILRFGAPIPTAGMADAEREALTQRVRGEVLRMRDEGRRELGPGELEAPALSGDPDASGDDNDADSGTGHAASAGS